MTLEDIIAGIFGGQGQMQPAAGPTPNDLIMGSLGASGAAPSGGIPFGMRRADSERVTQANLPPVAANPPPQVNAAPTPTSSQRAILPQSVPEPGVMDRMGALADGYGSGGLIGGIANAFTAPDQAVEAKRRELAQNNRTFRVMTETHGFAPDEAAMLVSNPKLLQEVLTSRYKQPERQLKEIFNEKTGRKQLASIDLTTGKYVPVGGDEAPSADRQTELVRNYEYARGNGFQGSLLDYVRANKVAETSPQPNELREVFDPATGRKVVASVDRATGSYVPVGGIEAERPTERDIREIYDPETGRKRVAAISKTDGTYAPVGGVEAGQVGPFKDVKERAGIEEGLRKEVTAVTKDWATIRDAHAKIKAVGAEPQPSPAGDMALVFGIMKLYDPGSVVRETEYATAENAASVPDRIRGMYNKVLEGVRLTPDQRADFLNQADVLANSQAKRTKQVLEQYQGVGERLGVDTRNVILDDPESVGEIGAKPKNAGALEEARKAIQQGASREKVIERLRQNGINPEGL